MVSCPVKRFSTLLGELGHSTVDVLKMDIEGGEMDALPDILAGKHDIGQLLVEFHYNYPAIGFNDFVAVVGVARSAGFRVCHISERGYEFSLIHESRL